MRDQDIWMDSLGIKTNGLNNQTEFVYLRSKQPRNSLDTENTIVYQSD